MGYGCACRDWGMGVISDCVFVIHMHTYQCM